MLILGLLSSVGINYAPELLDVMFQEPQYVCDLKPEYGIVSCDAFSKYGTEFGKCINATDSNNILIGNKICSDKIDGETLYHNWTQVIDNRAVIDDEGNETIEEVNFIFVIKKPADPQTAADMLRSALEVKKAYPSTTEFECFESENKCCVYNDKMQCKKIKEVEV